MKIVRFFVLLIKLMSMVLEIYLKSKIASLLTPNVRKRFEGKYFCTQITSLSVWLRWCLQKMAPLRRTWRFSCIENLFHQFVDRRQDFFSSYLIRQFFIASRFNSILFMQKFTQKFFHRDLIEKKLNKICLHT